MIAFAFAWSFYDLYKKGVIRKLSLSFAFMPVLWQRCSNQSKLFVHVFWAKWISRWYTKLISFLMYSSVKFSCNKIVSNLIFLWDIFLWSYLYLFNSSIICFIYLKLTFCACWNIFLLAWVFWSKSYDFPKDSNMALAGKKNCQLKSFYTPHPIVFSFCLLLSMNLICIVFDHNSVPHLG